MNTKPNVLIVDDRPENLLSVEAILESLHVQIYKANGADAALRCMLDVDFAVVLLDVEMPGIDGFQTARMIRSRERTRNIPIIFLTAIDRGDTSMQEGYALGAVDFLVKPVRPDVLRWKVSVFAELSRKANQERQLFEERIARAESEAIARQARLLANASASLASSLDEDVMLKNLMAVLVPESADCAALYKLERGRELHLNHFVHYDGAAYAPKHPMHSHVTFVRDKSLLARVFDSRAPVVTADAAEQELGDVHDDFVKTLGMRFVMFLPVRGQGESLGVLALYRSSAHRFTSLDETFAEDLADRLALSVSNAQLYKASQQASRAKDQFLAVVSHELRTPLTAILGWVHILQSKTIPAADVEKALRTIQRNAKLQSELIGDILDFSRFVTGQFAVKFEDVEIRSIVEQCIETVRPMTQEKGINLNYTSINDGSTVAGDPTRLLQVFSNLISNAVKFTSEGGSVDVSLNVTKSHVEVRVRDTGVGIDAEFIPQVFDPFIQADSSSTRSHSGLGLGLAIVRHLVEIHGGLITVASPGRDKGSTFTVSLPLLGRRALAS